MADTRTLKLSLLADVDKFTKGMDKADGSTKKLNKRVGGYSKKLVKAFAGVTTAVGLMAVAIGVDAVKAAAEDEVSQKKFRKALKNTAGVIDDKLLDSYDNWIEKMQFTSGYSDNDLRDSLGRLTRSTGKVSDAQDILTIALDTARGTGKPLITVADNLAKAYDGNYTPLKKMGIKLDKNTILSKDFKKATQKLTDLFGGQATEYADTYQGKLDIVNQKLGELKEASGKKLLDKFAILLSTTNDVADGFAGGQKNSLSERAKELSGQFKSKNGAYNLGTSLKEVADAFGKLFKALTGDKAKTGSDNLQTLADALSNVAKGITAIAKAYKKAKDIGGSILDALDLGMGKGETFGPGGKYNGILNPKNPNFMGGKALGGYVSGGQSYLVGERGPEIFTPRGSGGTITPNGGGGGVVINLNGIVDAESARRSIEQLIQRSARRSGAINWVGATL